MEDWLKGIIKRRPHFDRLVDNFVVAIEQEDEKKIDDCLKEINGYFGNWSSYTSGVINTGLVKELYKRREMMDEGQFKEFLYRLPQHLWFMCMGEISRWVVYWGKSE